MTEFGEAFTDFWLHGSSTVVLGSLSILLAGYYVMWFLFKPTGMYLATRPARHRLLVRAMNWVMFGGLFLSFEYLSRHLGLEIWRASARIALFFLILSELGWHLAMTDTLVREIKAWMNRQTS